jgi:hypothetical protein
MLAHLLSSVQSTSGPPLWWGSWRVGRPGPRLSQKCPCRRRAAHHPAARDNYPYLSLRSATRNKPSGEASAIGGSSETSEMNEHVEDELRITLQQVAAMARHPSFAFLHPSHRGPAPLGLMGSAAGSQESCLHRTFHRLHRSAGACGRTGVDSV